MESYPEPTSVYKENAIVSNATKDMSRFLFEDIFPALRITMYDTAQNA